MTLFRFFIFLSIVAFISCEKEDKPYVLPSPGNVEQAQVHMGEAYDTQVFFHFEDKKQYSSHLYDWDLEFETGPGHYLIRMNGGKQVQVYNTRNTNFNQLYSVTGVVWQWDSPDGNKDSVAFRDWYNTSASVSNNFVYLVDRGPDVTSDRYKKVQLLHVDQDKYEFVFANPDGSDLTNFTVEKDTSYNYMYFTFNNAGKVVSIEPGKINYDILFTRYRYIYNDLVPVLPYSVNGVLINPFHTDVAVDSITPFDSIDVAFASQMVYSGKYDVVGFDWKTYNFTSSMYEVNPKKCYVLKDQKGVYYKFRFINFYDNNGIKGAPEFEYQRL